MNQELIDFRWSHFFRVAFFVIENKFLESIDISFFSAGGVMFQTDCIAHLVEEFFPFSRGWSGYGSYGRRCHFRCFLDEIIV